MLLKPSPHGRRLAVSAGKGDTPRPVDAKVYGENYDDIFRKPQPQPQPTEQNETENKTDP